MWLTGERVVGKSQLFKGSQLSKAVQGTTGGPLQVDKRHAATAFTHYAVPGAALNAFSLADLSSPGFCVELRLFV